MSRSVPRFVAFHDLLDDAVDGVGHRLEALAALARIGLSVPTGFAIIDPQPDCEFLEGSFQSYWRSACQGSPVAVRLSVTTPLPYYRIMALTSITQAQIAKSVPEIIECIQTLFYQVESWIETSRSVWSMTEHGYDSETDITSITASRRDEEIGFEPPSTVGFSVFIQKYVEPKLTGVVYTGDPAGQDRSGLLIECSGEVQGRHASNYYILTRTADMVSCENPESAARIPHILLQQIGLQAIKVEKHYQRPVQLSFVISHSNVVSWISVHPIPALAEGNMNEFDTIPRSSSDVYTRHDIGELLYGALCPLTISICGSALERAYQEWMNEVTSQKQESTDSAIFTGLFFNHFFLNATALADRLGSVTAANSSLSPYQVSPKTQRSDSKDLSSLRAQSSTPMKRFLSGVKQLSAKLTASRHAGSVEILLQRLKQITAPSGKDSPLQVFLEIDKLLKSLQQSFMCYVQASYSTSAAYNALVDTIARIQAKNNSQEEGGIQLDSLSSAFNRSQSENISSATRYAIERMSEAPELRPAVAADFLKLLDALQASDSLIRAEFQQLQPREAASFLLSSKICQGDAGHLMEEFLVKHGQFSYNFVDMRQLPWSVDPSPIARALQIGLLRMLPRESYEMEQSELPSQTQAATSPTSRRHFSFAQEVPVPSERDVDTEYDYAIYPILYTNLQAAVSACRRQEELLRQLATILAYYKQAYQRLSQLISEDGLLPDDACLYFLTLEEIREFVNFLVEEKTNSVELSELNHNPRTFRLPKHQQQSHIAYYMSKKAIMRQQLYPLQQNLHFSAVSQPGIPVPTVSSIDHSGSHVTLHIPNKAPIFISSDATADVSQGWDGIVHGLPIQPKCEDGRSLEPMRGSVRVILKEADLWELEEGEILVANAIDAGWTPFVVLCSAVITDLGSPISHAAFLCRSLSQPAILQTLVATRVLRTGDQVEVDVSLGTVTLLQRRQSLKESGVAKPWNMGNFFREPIL
eukprot:TRINITY_DN2082_c0_g1_i6.p1 TRINITY_DN2082_c0_g1~~TRINITY_DN2082_c0_g1_i6.p1  ORF type:complete len:984 (+),score=205.64 TRINITY_DN2082_c0_g1_i6:67-3018(+)